MFAVHCPGRDPFVLATYLDVEELRHRTNGVHGSNPGARRTTRHTGRIDRPPTPDNQMES